MKIIIISFLSLAVLSTSYGQGVERKLVVINDSALVKGRPKSLTDATGPAGGDLSGIYPIPVVTGMFGKRLVVPAPLSFGDYGKVFKYNGSLGQWDLGYPVESYENLNVSNLNVNGNGGNPKVTRSPGGENMIPMAYGHYDGPTNTLTFNTSNVTVTRFALGRYSVQIHGVTIGFTWNPVTTATMSGLSTGGFSAGLISSHNVGVAYVEIDTYNPNGTAAEGAFDFVIYNR